MDQIIRDSYFLWLDADSFCLLSTALFEEYTIFILKLKVCLFVIVYGYLCSYPSVCLSLCFSFTSSFFSLGLCFVITSSSSWIFT